MGHQEIDGVSILSSLTNKSVRVENPLKFDEIDRGSLRVALSLRKYICSQFKPNVAKALYDFIKAKNVLDISAGWGDRLCGFFASEYGEHYVGIDPRKENHPIYEKQAEFYKKNNGFFETDKRATAIIDAERQFLDSGLPATIVRFAGIYGGSSARLLSKVARGEVASSEPVRYTNRIHREDCAGFLLHLIEMAENHQHLAPSYNGVDDSPCPAHEVEQWLAKALGVTVNSPSEDSTTGQVSHKRCRNDLLHACGYQLRHPDYRSGYSEVLATSQ